MCYLTQGLTSVVLMVAFQASLMLSYLEVQVSGLRAAQMLQMRLQFVVLRTLIHTHVH